jgi:transposase
MGYRRIRPRRIPINRDEQQVENFKINFKTLYDNFEVWYYDETGIEGDSPLRLVWCCGKLRKECYYSGSHIRESLLGAVNPKTGGFESLIMPYTDGISFQYFLDYFNAKLKDRIVLMVMDNASWHKSKSINWGNVIPIYLPAYSPDLNPIEVLWKVIKDRLYDPIPVKDYEELKDRIQVVVRQLINNPKEVKSICKVKY